MAKKFLDQAGVKQIFSKLKEVFVQKEEGKGLSTNDFTDALKNKLDNVSTSIPEYDTMAGATSSAAGSAGLVPAPAAGDQDSFLKGDGTWEAVSAITTDEIDAAYNEVFAS